jgi:subtilase family serine protease
MPDLTIASLEQSSQDPVMGDKVVFTLEITNQGSKLAGDSVLQMFVDESLSGKREIPEIGPGGSVNATFTWLALAGEHTVNILADGTDAVEEGIEENNGEIMVFSVPAPDLAITGVTWSPSENITAHDVVAITTTVKNLGNARARPCHISYLLSGEPLSSGVVDELRPNATTKTTFNLLAGEAGSHAVGIILDEENYVAESDETNNRETVFLSLADSGDPPPGNSPATNSPPRQRPPPIELNPGGEPSSSELIFIVPVFLVAGILVFSIIRLRKKA